MCSARMHAHACACTIAHAHTQKALAKTCDIASITNNVLGCKKQRLKIKL